VLTLPLIVDIWRWSEICWRMASTAPLVEPTWQLKTGTWKLFEIFELMVSTVPPLVVVRLAPNRKPFSPECSRLSRCLLVTESAANVFDEHGLS
jgi:hypothetical protein